MTLELFWQRPLLFYNQKYDPCKSVLAQRKFNILIILMGIRHLVVVYFIFTHYGMNNFE